MSDSPPFGSASTSDGPVELGPSIPQQELLAIDQGPDDVFPRLAPVARTLDVGDHGRTLGRGRLAAERSEVDLAQDLGIPEAGPQEPADPVLARVEFAPHRLAVDHLEGLREGRCLRSFALTG